MALSYTVDPEARGMRNVFVVRVWNASLRCVAKLYRRNEIEAHVTGRRYCDLLGR